MTAGVGLKQRVQTILRKASEADIEVPSSRPTVLVATMDPQVRSDLTEVLDAFSFKAIWLQCVAAAKSILTHEKVAACFCGMWLQDGTYRELVRHVRRECATMPMILLSPPADSREYAEYLATMNLGSLDFLSHPYRKSDIERIFGMAVPVVGAGVSMTEEPVVAATGFAAGEAA